MAAAGRATIGLTVPAQVAVVTALIALVTLFLAHRAGIPSWHAALTLSMTLGLPLGALLRTSAPRLGWANTVTLLRLGLASLVLAGLPRIDTADPPIWLLAGVACAAWLLDAVDGWLARALREASSFGARLDMETDALLLIACTLVLVTGDRVGPWVLAAGLLRPSFVLAGRLLPWLTRALPPSRRRKLLCAIPLGLLIAAMLPPVSAPAATAAAAAALGLLAISFMIDIAWLWRQRSWAAPPVATDPP